MSIRDPAHFIRTAIKTPLEETGNFAKQHHELFGKKHALLKDLQHSRMWQARLDACQNVLVKFQSDGAGPSRSAGPSCGPPPTCQITHFLRHIGYVALEWSLRLVKIIEVTIDWLEKQVPVILGRRDVALRVNDLVTAGREWAKRS